MKENKFRIWDKVNKTYNEPDNFNYAITTEGAIRGLGHYGIEHDRDIIELLVQKNYDIEFYTGLKNKYCKEIYEGDIVLFDVENNSCCKINKIGIIAYNQNKLSFEIKLIHGEHKGKFLSINRGYDAYSNSLCVIGNIHENPELLEVNE